MIGDSVKQTFTLMAAGLNTTKAAQQSKVKRNLQLYSYDGVNPTGNDTYVDLPDSFDEDTGATVTYTNVDVTLHNTHESGMQVKFRGNKVLKIRVPIDKVV
jgi:hypothetical protein